MKLYDIASRMAGFLACHAGLDESRVDTVRFGLELILGEIIKLIVLLGASMLLGIVPGTMFAMISMAVFRTVSGGAHCEDYWRCLVFGSLVFLGGGKLGVFVAPFLTQPYIVLSIAAGSLAMALAVLIWAPGEVPNRKTKVGERGRFRMLSLIYLAIWAGLTIFVIAPRNVPAAMAGLLAMLVQTFSFTPLGYVLINRFDLFLSRILGERRCSHA